MSEIKQQLTSEFLAECDPIKERRRLIASRTARDAFGTSYYPPPRYKVPDWVANTAVCIGLFVLSFTFWELLTR